jgi:succinoglycan biosynthesis transport protein ExoP
VTSIDNDLSTHSAYAHTQPASPATTTADILLILRRGWYLPLLGCLIGLAAATAYVLVAPQLYKSSARILIDKSVNRFLQANKILEVPTFDDAETGSQVYILSSESIILPIVRSMDLAHDPEFVGASSGTPSSSEREAALERTAVETFLKRLNVTREDVADVITVTFSSEDSKKAARIVNAIVDSYIENTSDAKRKSARIASQLLEERLTELKQSVMSANKALQDFRMSHNVVNKGAGLSTEQISGLTTQLTNAKMQVAATKAQLDHIQEANRCLLSTEAPTGSFRTCAVNEAASGTLFPDNQVIAGLRSKYLELSTKANELASRVGPHHFAVIQLRKEMDEARAAIRDEEKRTAGSYVTAYQVAQTQNDELAAMVARLSEEARTESEAQIPMRELESTAESLLVLYRKVVEQFGQLSKQPLDSVQDASIITRGAPPLHKSSNKSLAVLVGGVVGGLLFGAGGAVAREFAAGVFRTPDQVKQATGIYCVSVPSVKANRKPVASQRASTNSDFLGEFVLDAPHSRFTESFRNIKALVDDARRTDGGKVIGIVSPVANDGKSTIGTNLAAVMAASARTLVIDGDLHKRNLTAKLEPDAREGLIEALDDPSRLAALVTKRPRSGFDLLPCVLSKRILNAADLLGSPQMERLLIAARVSYDCIIVECPPIMSVVDVKMIERLIDRFVFVIGWGQTTRRVTQEALDECDITRERILCVVLNKVDPSALRSIEAYKGPQLLEYYQT